MRALGSFVASSAFVAFTLGAAPGCSKPAPPTLSVDRLTITRMDLQGVAVDASIGATNGNSVDLTVSAVTSHLVLDKTHDVGTVTITKPVTLPAGQKTTIDAPLTMTWTDVGLLTQLAGGTAAVPYSIDGSVELGGNLLHVAVPFHLEGSFTHAQIVAAMATGLAIPH